MGAHGKTCLVVALTFDQHALGMNPFRRHHWLLFRASSWRPRHVKLLCTFSTVQGSVEHLCAIILS